MQTRQRDLYDGCAIEHPDGTLMCRVREKRARWYVSRGLAEVVGEEPLVVRLNFEPNGRGNAGDDFYLVPRENRCVCCAEEGGLTSHHVVPHHYRRHFPVERKSHSSHDLLALCAACHDRYEARASELRARLASECDAPLDGRGARYDPQRARLRKAASALRRHRHDPMTNIPKPRVEELLALLRAELGKEQVTDDDIERACGLDPYDMEQWVSHGELVVAAVGDLDELVHRWRRHFVETMEPRFLPAHWSVDRSE